jgi:hypothetical protein
MTLPRTVAEVLRDHVTLETQSIDRMYLNVYVPQLQSVGGVVGYLHAHKGQRLASTAALAPMTRDFARAIDRFAKEHGVDIVDFAKRQRKDEVTQRYLARFRASEGVLYIGKAQEKARVMRTERRRNACTGVSYPWIVPSTAMVNHIYFYCVDEDFGPFFLKFCTYFPYNAKLCLNGNAYAKRQLRKRAIAFQALDNGVRRCDNPKALQRICDGPDATKIERLLRKWLARLPHPFPKEERASGCRYALSILQAEFLPHPGPEPAGDGACVLRGCDPRKPRPRPSQSSTAHLRAPCELAHPRALSHAGHHRRRHPFAACGLQTQPHQAVPQGRSGAAHRNHHQRHPRLRHRPAAAQRGGARARWASTPTDVCWTSKRSATTVPWAKPICSVISDPRRSTGSAHRRCVSPMRACRP